MKRSRLKRPKPYRRTPEQILYHGTFPFCELCGQPAMPTPHHVDPRLRRKDTHRNMVSLCWNHHIGNEGVHTIGLKRFVEMFALYNEAKWRNVYDRVKNR